VRAPAAILREVSLFGPIRRSGAVVTPMARGSTEIPVDACLIRSVTYGTDATLTVCFHNGAVYRYFTVPRTILDGLLAAPSKGAYFNLHIREGFPYRRLADPAHS
jgi:hypothetical protein